MTSTPKYSRAYFPALAEKMETLVRADPHTGCWEWTRALNADGYGHGLFHEGRQIRAHRVAFLVSMGELPPSHEPIRHLCSNPACCRPDHLAVGTALENAQDTVEAGRYRKSKKSYVQKKRDALAIRLAEGTDAQIAKDLAVSISTVNRVRRGRTWKASLGFKPLDGSKKRKVPGAQDRRVKLNAEAVRAIRASHESDRVLAERFGVTSTNIKSVRTLRTWKHVS